MPAPLVTIVTPAYQAARYVRACVESVLAQTYPRWELVVADDGSADGTPDLVEAYADPRIRVLRLPHRGLPALAATYNAAVAAGSGELVAVLEGDDLWPSDKLAVQVRGFEDPDVVLSWGAGRHVDDAGAVLREVRFAPAGTGDVRLSTREVFRLLLTRDVLVPTAAVMLRRDALAAAGGFVRSGATHYVDLPTWLRALARRPGAVLWHDHVLGLWRRHAAQTTAHHITAMDRHRWRVVRNAVRDLDAAALDAVGWTEREARGNAARWALACGRAALADRRFGRARRLFLASLRLDATAVRRKALVGAASAALHVDLSGAWRGARRRAPPPAPTRGPA